MRIEIKEQGGIGCTRGLRNTQKKRRWKNNFLRLPRRLAQNRAGHAQNELFCALLDISPVGVYDIHYTKLALGGRLSNEMQWCLFLKEPGQAASSCSSLFSCLFVFGLFTLFFCFVIRMTLHGGRGGK